MQEVLVEEQADIKELKIKRNSMKVIKCIGCFIRIGSITEHLIGLITLGHGKTAASWVARKLGYSNCGCDRRRITMNQWTCKSYSETISIL
jgi:hypothetical protein